MLPSYCLSFWHQTVAKYWAKNNQAWCLKYTFRVGTKKGQQGWLVSQHPTWINATKCIKLTETRLHNFTHQLKSVSKFFKIGSIKTLIHLGYRLNTHWKTTNPRKLTGRYAMKTCIHVASRDKIWSQMLLSTTLTLTLTLTSTRQRQRQRHFQSDEKTCPEQHITS